MASFLLCWLLGSYYITIKPKMYFCFRFFSQGVSQRPRCCVAACGVFVDHAAPHDEFSVSRQAVDFMSYAAVCSLKDLAVPLDFFVFKSPHNIFK